MGWVRGPICSITRVLAGPRAAAAALSTLTGGGRLELLTPVVHRARCRYIYRYKRRGFFEPIDYKPIASAELQQGTCKGRVGGYCRSARLWNAAIPTSPRARFDQCHPSESRAANLLHAAGIGLLGELRAYSCTELCASVHRTPGERAPEPGASHPERLE